MQKLHFAVTTDKSLLTIDRRILSDRQYLIPNTWGSSLIHPWMSSNSDLHYNFIERSLISIDLHALYQTKIVDDPLVLNTDNIIFQVYAQ